MYFHAGQDFVLNTRDVIGVFDLDTAGASRRTEEYFRHAENEGAVVDLCAPGTLPKSFMVTDFPDETVYISQPGPPLCVIARQRAAALLLRAGHARPLWFCYGSALDHHNFPIRPCKRGGVAGRHNGLVLAHAGQQVGLALVVQLAQNVIQQ